ncbi:MAG: sensor histidine kinase [Pseudomonadota bacterium]
MSSNPMTDSALATGAWPRFQPLTAPEGPAWRLLVLLALFRMSFAALLLCLSQLPMDTGLHHLSTPPFPALLLAQIALGGFWLFTLAGRRFGLAAQSWLQLGLDLPWICILIWATGGLGSGLGLVLLLSCVGAGLVMPRRQALTYAALASLHILGFAALAAMSGEAVTWPHAGLLGAAAFGATWGVNILTRRADDSALVAYRASRELDDLARLNEVIIERLHHGLLVISPRGRVRLANAQAQNLLGPAPKGARLAEIAPELEAHWARWRLGDDGERPTLSCVGDRECALHFVPLGEEGAVTLITLEDLGEAKARMQAMKLSALGRLTAGIAHEIRNPLSAISHAGALLSESDLSPGDQQLVTMVCHHATRINAIVADILQLSRQRPSAPESLHLGAWLDTFLSHYRAGLDPQTERIDLRCEAQHVNVRMDPGHLSQVLTNLLDNARHHGRPASGPLIVTIHCERFAAGGRIHLQITDNGPGIPADAAARLFEPFFTTSRSGTGLGLYLSRELCEFNGASLAHLPDEAGCRFRISLPLADRKKD